MTREDFDCFGNINVVMKICEERKLRNNNEHVKGSETDRQTDIRTK